MGALKLARQAEPAPITLSVGAITGIAIGGAVCLGLVVLGGLVAIIRWRHDLNLEHTSGAGLDSVGRAVKRSSQAISNSALKRLSGVYADWDKISSEENVEVAEAVASTAPRSAFEDDVEPTKASKLRFWRVWRPDLGRRGKKIKPAAIFRPSPRASVGMRDLLQSPPERAHDGAHIEATQPQIPTSFPERPRPTHRRSGAENFSSSTVTVLRIPPAGQDNAVVPSSVSPLSISISQATKAVLVQDSSHGRSSSQNKPSCMPPMELPPLPASAKSFVHEKLATMRQNSRDSVSSVGSTGSSILHLSSSPPHFIMDELSLKHSLSTSRTKAQGLAGQNGQRDGLPKDMAALRTSGDHDIFTEANLNRLSVGKIHTAEFLSVHRVSSNSDLVPRQVESSSRRETQVLRVSMNGSPPERQRHPALQPISGNRNAPTLRSQNIWLKQHTLTDTVNEAASVSHRVTIQPAISSLVSRSAVEDNVDDTIELTSSPNAWPLSNMTDERGPGSERNHLPHTRNSNPDTQLAPPMSRYSLTRNSLTVSPSQLHPAQRCTLEHSRPLPVYQQEFSMHLYEAREPSPKSRNHPQQNPALHVSHGYPTTTPNPLNTSTAREYDHRQNFVNIPGLNVLASVAAAQPRLQDSTPQPELASAADFREIEESDLVEALRECEDLFINDQPDPTKSNVAAHPPCKLKPKVMDGYATTSYGPITSISSPVRPSPLGRPILSVPFPALQHPGGPRAAPAQDLKKSVEKLRRENSEALASNTRSARRYLKFGREASPMLSGDDSDGKENDLYEHGIEWQRSRVWDEGEAAWNQPKVKESRTPTSPSKGGKRVTWGNVDVRMSVPPDTPVSRKSLYDAGGFLKEGILT